MGRDQAMQAATTIIPSAQPTAPLTAPVVQSGADPIVDPAPKVELDSTRFNLLAKKEAEIQRERESYKKDREAYNADLAKLKGVQEQIATFEKLRETDKIAAIKSLGFSDTDLINLFASLEDNSTPEEKAQRAAQKTIDEFKKEQADNQTKAQQEANKRVLESFNRSIVNEFKRDPEKYEYCNYYGEIAQALVESTATQIIESGGELPFKNGQVDYTALVEMVENYYESEDKAMNSLKKRAPKETTTAPIEPVEQLKPEVSSRPRPTLSSKTSQTIASTTPKPVNETPDQKKQRLIAKYLGSAS